MLTIFDWVRLMKLDKFIWHTANERKTSPQAGALLKRMGQKAGVSDITIARASKGFHGAFIEVKVGKNRPTELQLEFLDTMTKEGYFAKVCIGVDETIYTIKEYLGLFH
jgi:hypothetical protein